MNTEKLLQNLRNAESEIDTIQRTGGFRRESPKAFDVLEQIRGLLNIAFVKINEGDDCQ